jgi:hypothetical protein
VSPAIQVFDVSKIQDAQVGSVRTVLPVAFPVTVNAFALLLVRRVLPPDKKWASGF